MVENKSYTPDEVAGILKISKYTVYEMIKRGDLAAYRIGRKVRVESDELEKYKQKSKNIPTISLPNLKREQVQQTAIVICGQDIVLDILTRHLEKCFPKVSFLRNYVGSMEGLLALYRGTAHIATAHMWDGDEDIYNTPYVRRLLPGHEAVLINLIKRRAGLYVAKNNPLKIIDWDDFARTDIKIINRECGSGARVLLDENLRKKGFKTKFIKGYADIETSHLAVASKVSRGEADVGIGVEKAAFQVQNIDFIPLKQEQYDLVIKKEDLDNPIFNELINILKSEAFINDITGIGGYDLSHTGQIVSET